MELTPEQRAYVRNLGREYGRWLRDNHDPERCTTTPCGPCQLKAAERRRRS
ncbi:hypothetical protein [Micromonospora arborensis]|uniref:hypothetical protein n=1 Tax=Micromonospora arborensis TaxID=2116518 RepID=UPI00142D8D9E|nr:hypothetical protein [Micromonospora arborensis]